jgi:hypothetical protein
MAYRLFSATKTTGSPQACHVERLVEVARVRGAVAEETEHHAVAILKLLGQGRAHRHRDVAAHDAGRPQIAVVHVGDVH